MFLDPDHNGQLLPAGRKLQPLRNVAVIIFPSSFKNKGHFNVQVIIKPWRANRRRPRETALAVALPQRRRVCKAIDKQRRRICEDFLQKISAAQSTRFD